MNAAGLLKHYDRIADAPDAVAKLRRLILDLAVRGKLVAQDSKDELTFDLLSRIAQEKANGRGRDVTGRLRKSDEMSVADLPFGMPEGWVAVKLEQVLIELQTGPFGSSLHQSDYVQGGTPVINPASIQDERIVPIAKMAIGPASLARLESFKVRAGDIVLARRGEMGRCAAVTELEHGWLCGTGSLILRPSRLMCARFIVLLIGSPLVREYLGGASVGATMQNLNQGILLNLAFGLPPAAEQHRIVAKVDELMALCDQLEAARAEREARRDRLATASLGRLNAPDPETFHDDARFVLDILPALTAHPDQVRQLRQTILSLAMCGRLVLQNPEAEPASAMLARLHVTRKCKRKIAIVDEGELSNPLPAIPPTWTWATVDQISADSENAITDGPFGSQLKTEHYVPTPGFRVVRLQNIGNGNFRDEHRSYVDEARFQRLAKHYVQSGDLVVAGLVDPRVRCCEIPPNFGPALVKADCYRLAVHSKLVSRFVLHFLNSQIAQEFAAVHHHGMTLTRIGLGNFRRIPIPLPPIEEQRRIVAKVDEMMSLCDRLQSRLDTGNTTRSRLLDALLQEALEPAIKMQESA